MRDLILTHSLQLKNRTIPDEPLPLAGIEVKEEEGAKKKSIFKRLNPLKRNLPPFNLGRSCLLAEGSGLHLIPSLLASSQQPSCFVSLPLNRPPSLLSSILHPFSSSVAILKAWAFTLLTFLRPSWMTHSTPTSTLLTLSLMNLTANHSLPGVKLRWIPCYARRWRIAGHPSFERNH